MSTLDGATTRGEPFSYPSTPGEFAARWNGWDDSRRTAWLALMVEDQMKAGSCWQQDHAGRIETLERAAKGPVVTTEYETAREAMAALGDPLDPMPDAFTVVVAPDPGADEVRQRG